MRIRNFILSHRVLTFVIVAVLSVVMTVGTVFAAVAISNVWQSPTITVVTSPPSGGGGGTPPTLPLVVGSADFTTDQNITQGYFYDFSVNLSNPSAVGSASYPAVRVQFDVTKTDGAIASGDVELWYKESPESSVWLSLPVTLVDAKLTGLFGPESGFPVVAGYDATTPIRAKFNTLGTYDADAYAISVP